MSKTTTGFNQLCVWPATVLGDSTVQEFEDFFKEHGFRVQFADEVVTNPTPGEPDTGGRHDVLFFIHDEDTSKFALWRLGLGIRWWEDVVSYNHESYLYDKEVLDKYPVRW